MTAWWGSCGVHAADLAAAPDASATQNPCDSIEARRLSREVIAFACRMVGRKRGFALAGRALGKSERWIHGFHYHDEGAAPDCDTAMAALMAMRRARAAQLRAELATIEGDDFADQVVARASAGGRVCG